MERRIGRIRMSGTDGSIAMDLRARNMHLLPAATSSMASRDGSDQPSRWSGVGKPRGSSSSGMQPRVQVIEAGSLLVILLLIQLSNLKTRNPRQLTSGQMIMDLLS